MNFMVELYRFVWAITMPSSSHKMWYIGKEGKCIITESSIIEDNVAGLFLYEKVNPGGVIIILSFYRCLLGILMAH